MLGKMLGQETDETNEDFLDALGRLPASDGQLLGILHVEQEDGIEHAQHLIFIAMVGVQVGYDFAHLRQHFAYLTQSTHQVCRKSCTFAGVIQQKESEQDDNSNIKYRCR